MPASAFASNVFQLPLVDIREEVRTLINGLTTPSAVLYPSQFATWPIRTAAQFVPAAIWSATTSGGAPVLLVNGTAIRRLGRAAAQNSVGAPELPFPLAWNPGGFPNGALPPGMAERRRYTWEWCMFGDAPFPGSILCAGIATRTGGTQQLPANAFTDTSQYCFRRVSTENGGLWQVAWRRGLAVEALNLIPTTLSSTIPRTFKIVYTEGANGGVGDLVLSIDGATVATFTPANIPTPALGGSAFWCPSVGTEGAADAATFDYLYGSKFRVEAI